MEKWRGRVALVTGASAGIGEAVVRQLVTHGMKVVGCARNVDKIKALAEELKTAPGSLYPIKCNLRNEEEILSMFKQIKSQLGGVDVCVNSAGLGSEFSSLISGKTEKWREMFEVNVLALAICTRETIASMKERNVDDGHIIHISSMSGHRVEWTAFGHFLAGTKHAVRAMTEGLRMELRQMKSHIRVSALSPGNVDTEFTSRVFSGNPEKIAENTSPFKELEAREMADCVVFALGAPAHMQVHDILVRPVEQDS